jgi:hypothetical protein
MNKKLYLMILGMGSLYNVLAMDDDWIIVEPEEENLAIVAPGEPQRLRPIGENPIAEKDIQAYYQALHNAWAKIAQRYRNQGVDFFDWAGYRKFEGYSDRDLETLKDLFSVQFGPYRDEQKIKEIKHKLVGNYKIHLMPYDEDISIILNRLLREITTNPSFKRHVHSFKIKLATRDLKKGDEIMPKIVIYPASSKESAQIVLDKVYELTKDIKGMNITPRYNEKMTDLIYVAQGDGDYKGRMQAEFYEPSFIYYKPTFEDGAPKNYHLKNPAMNEWEIIEE